MAMLATILSVRSIDCVRISVWCTAVLCILPFAVCSVDIPILFPGAAVQNSTANGQRLVYLGGALRGRQAVFQVALPKRGNRDESLQFQRVAVTTCSPYTSLDTVLFLFNKNPIKTSNGPAPTFLDSNDNDCGEQSTIEFTLSSASPFFVLLTGYGSSEGPYEIRVISLPKTPTDIIPWGLDRIDQRSLPLNGQFSVQQGGKDVSVYILDSGVRITHSEFQQVQSGRSRAHFGTDVVNRLHQSVDVSGHGTHVAGIVAGKTYGVAKEATIVSVRVLDRDGNGHVSHLLEGLQWTMTHVREKNPPAALVVMSVSTRRNKILNDAVDGIIKSGLAVVTAAGNAGNDSCAYSPASATSAITVAASNINDSRSSFSNFGGCINLYAPGENIVSAWHTGDDSTRDLSGTSAACPYVAGTAAVLLAENPSLTPFDVSAVLYTTATKSVVQQNETIVNDASLNKDGSFHSNNRLIYVRSVPVVLNDSQPSGGYMFLYVIFEIRSEKFDLSTCELPERGHQLLLLMTDLLTPKEHMKPNVTMRLCCFEYTSAGCDTGRLWNLTRLVIRLETKAIHADAVFNMLSDFSSSTKTLTLIGSTLQANVKVLAEPWVVDAKGRKYWAAPSLMNVPEGLSTTRTVFLVTGIGCAILLLVFLAGICMCLEKERRLRAKKQHFEKMATAFEDSQMKQSNVMSLQIEVLNSYQEGIRRVNSEVQGDMLLHVTPSGSLPTPQVLNRTKNLNTGSFASLGILKGKLSSLFEGISSPTHRSPSALTTENSPGRGTQLVSRLNTGLRRTPSASYESSLARTRGENQRNRSPTMSGRSLMRTGVVRILSFGPGHGGIAQPASPSTPYPDFNSKQKDDTRTGR